MPFELSLRGWTDGVAGYFIVASVANSNTKQSTRTREGDMCNRHIIMRK